MPDIISILLQSFWLTLPAAAANMAPVLANRLNVTRALNQPLDGGVIWHGKRLLGPNKTLRGLFWGILIGAVVGGVQGWVASKYAWGANVSLFYVHTWSFGIIAGALLGFATLASDAVKSFFKRRRAMAPGESWVLIDQLDVVIGVTLSAWLVSDITRVHIFIIILGGMLITYAVSFISVQMNIKEKI